MNTSSGPVDKLQNEQCRHGRSQEKWVSDNLINQRAEPLFRYKTRTTSWRVFETLHVFFVTNFTVQDLYESAEFSNVCIPVDIRVQRFLHIHFEQEYFCGAFFYQFHYIFVVNPL